MGRSNRRASASLRYLIALIVAFLVVTACGSDSDTGTSMKFDDATTSKLNQILDAQFVKSGLPGVVVSIWIGDQQWVQSRGVADLNTKAPYKIDDQGRIASISKTFTATAILQLVDQKKISLDDKLESFVPGIVNGTKITVRDLLDMQSGLYDFTADDAFVNAFDANPTLPWTPAQSIDIVKAHPADFEPGAKTVYCDSNYILLGMILEKVTGRKAHDVINTDVVAKLPGLSKTNFPTGTAVPEPHPTAYLPDENDTAKPPTVVNDVNPEVGWTAGAMTSTIEDLKVWGKELTDGSLLSPDIQRERLHSNRIDGVPINLGYGLGVMTINDLVGHNGAIVGYSSVVLRLPQADATFVAIGNASTNETTPTTEIILELIKQLYPEQVK
jgi:D-alanyl-D-alanine carboxypeptidase